MPWALLSMRPHRCRYFAPTGPGPERPSRRKGALFLSAESLGLIDLHSSPALDPGESLQHLSCLLLTGEHLDHLLPVGADPAPVADQADGPEQIPLDHEAVEAPNALLQVDPVQHQVVLDRGAEIVRNGLPSAPKSPPLTVL